MNNKTDPQKLEASLLRTVSNQLDTLMGVDNTDRYWILKVLKEKFNDILDDYLIAKGK